MELMRELGEMGATAIEQHRIDKMRRAVEALSSGNKQERIMDNSD